MSPYLTVIFGDNAQGKTNLLEGIYFILKGAENNGEKTGNSFHKGIYYVKDKITEIANLPDNSILILSL